MGYNLQVVAPDIGVNFNCKFDNMADAEKPEVIAKTSDGRICSQKTFYRGCLTYKGDISRAWADDQGNIPEPETLKFYMGDEEVKKNEMTKVFNVTRYEPLSNYTDTYVIDRYYELSPSNNGKKSDFDRDIAIKTNLSQMRRLWEHLNNSGQVARAEFCAASHGFVSGDGYIRAVSIEGKWGLEIGVFKQRKTFQHLNESTTFHVEQSTSGPKKVRML